MPAIFPASSKGGGVCFAFPDVCKTPPGPVPAPYANMAPLNQATKTVPEVKLVQKPAVTTNSEVPKTMGDEPGVAGGVVSNQNMGKLTIKNGCAKVKVKGHPIARLCSATGHNGMNANVPSGMQVAPSQAKVIVAP